MTEALAQQAISMRCPKCNSENICRGAIARWDLQLQDWDVSYLVQGPIVCDDCKHSFNEPKPVEVLLVELVTMH